MLRAIDVEKNCTVNGESRCLYVWMKREEGKERNVKEINRLVVTPPTAQHAGLCCMGGWRWRGELGPTTQQRYGASEKGERG